VRSQIVPRPALTLSATQASALLRHLIDLLSFSIHNRAIIIHYIDFKRYADESIVLYILYYYSILLWRLPLLRVGTPLKAGRMLGPRLQNAAAANAEP
jgi:hypothetical protein